MTTTDSAHQSQPEPPFGLCDVLSVVRDRAWWLAFCPAILAVAAFALAYNWPPTFTARTTLLIPQPQQSAALAAIQGLGAMTGSLSGSKTSADQYASLMQSANVVDRLIDRFQLMSVYGSRLRIQARRELEANTRIAVGKRDGFLSIDVDDHDAKRAAEIANAYVDELKRITSELSVTEAQQRRSFFEDQLSQTRVNLARSQQALQVSGINEGSIRVEPKAATESYSRSRAEIAAAEVRLQSLRSLYADGSLEIQQASQSLQALRSQLTRIESQNTRPTDSGYIDRLREYRYQETLLEMFIKQYEIARVDESRDGGWLQVVDIATMPEQKSSPKTVLIACLTFVASFTLLLLLLIFIKYLNRHTFNQANLLKNKMPEGESGKASHTI